MNRRQFLIRGSAFVAALTAAGLWPGMGRLQADGGSLPTGGTGRKPVLVVVQLDGGNDGINTLIPYGQGAYFDARPTLAYKESEVLPITGGIGFHPSFKSMKGYYDAGQLAIIQGVGYPEPNRSHFRSKDIWQTAVSERIESDGWLGRYTEQTLSDDRNPLKALEISKYSSKALQTNQVSAPLLQAVESYHWINPNTPNEQKNRLARAFQRMYGLGLTNTKISVGASKGADAYASVEAIQSLKLQYEPTIKYPAGDFARDLQLVVKLLSAGSGTRVFFTELGGFDDHADEKGQHADLLKVYDQSIGAFYEDLKLHGWGDDVIVLTYSEFGRRVKENGSGGTDHGAAAPVFVLGGRVKGGMYGEYPSLSRLDNGDLKYNVDFRSVYASVLEDWLGADANAVLGKRYEKLKFT